MVRWEAGGEIRCLAASPSGARGYPAHLVIFDEYAHFTKEIDMDRRMLEAVAPSIAQVGGRLILLSTPNGTKNELYEHLAPTGNHRANLPLSPSDATSEWSMMPQPTVLSGKTKKVSYG